MSLSPKFAIASHVHADTTSVRLVLSERLTCPTCATHIACGTRVTFLDNRGVEAPNVGVLPDQETVIHHWSTSLHFSAAQGKETGRLHEACRRRDETSTRGRQSIFCIGCVRNVMGSEGNPEDLAVFFWTWVPLSGLVVLPFGLLRSGHPRREARPGSPSSSPHFGSCFSGPTFMVVGLGFLLVSVPLCSVSAAPAALVIPKALA